VFFVYVLKSLVDGKLYIGQTSNLEKRLAIHSEGRVRSTRKRYPLRLIHFEKYETRGEAIKRERFLKSIKGRDFKQQLRNNREY